MDSKNDNWLWNISKIQDQRTLWNYKPGLINSFPRPQGKLPSSEWLYKKDQSPKTMINFNKSNTFDSLYGSLTYTPFETKNLLSW